MYLLNRLKTFFNKVISFFQPMTIPDANLSAGSVASGKYEAPRYLNGTRETIYYIIYNGTSIHIKLFIDFNLYTLYLYIIKLK